MTPRRLKLMAYIQNYLDQNGLAPTFEEIRRHMGLASKGAVHALVKALEGEGRIRCTPRHHRSIEIVQPLPADIAQRNAA